MSETCRAAAREGFSMAAECDHPSVSVPFVSESGDKVDATRCLSYHKVETKLRQLKLWSFKAPTLRATQGLEHGVWAAGDTAYDMGAATIICRVATASPLQVAAPSDNLLKLRPKVEAPLLGKCADLHNSLAQLFASRARVAEKMPESGGRKGWGRGGGEGGGGQEGKGAEGASAHSLPSGPGGRSRRRAVALAQFLAPALQNWRGRRERGDHPMTTMAGPATAKREPGSNGKQPATIRGGRAGVRAGVRARDVSPMTYCRGGERGEMGKGVGTASQGKCAFATCMPILPIAHGPTVSHLEHNALQPS